MKPRSTFQQALALLGFIVLTFLAPAAGAFSPPGAWYQTLEKPSWNPPSWIFGPVWTLLYLGMAVAAWLVWKRGEQGHALRLYVVQLALNAAWTPVFFGAHQLGAAFIVIVCMWIAILLTLRAFWTVSRPAGLLFVPYLAWVSFASMLNFTLWRLNS
ncbi:MAG: tryptophan-rich sensory protein [Verrucomicrobiaceae bacterium]|nr:tryptophan-rich sensory protein [Verrucomicrobiaceae bacterium]